MGPTEQESISKQSSSPGLQEDLSSTEEQQLLTLLGGGDIGHGSQILELASKSFHRGCNTAQGSPTLGLVHVLQTLVEPGVWSSGGSRYVG